MKRPGWLPPTWIVLAGSDLYAKGKPAPIYVEALAIGAVGPGVEGGSSVVVRGVHNALVVDETAEQVFAKITEATR